MNSNKKLNHSTLQLPDTKGMVEMTPKWLRSNVVRFFKRIIFRLPSVAGPVLHKASVWAQGQAWDVPLAKMNSSVVQYPHGCELTSCKMDIPILPPRMEEKYIYIIPRGVCSVLVGPLGAARVTLQSTFPRAFCPTEELSRDPQLQWDWRHLMAHRMDWWRQFTSCWCWQSPAWIKFSEGSTMITSSNPTAGSTSPSPELSLDISSHSFRRGPRGHKIFGHSNSVVVFCSGSGFLLWSKTGRGCHCKQCLTPLRATGGDSSLPLRQQIHVDQVGPHKLGRTNLLCWSCIYIVLIHPLLSAPAPGQSD